MNEFIEVWRPKIAIPASLKEAVANVGNPTRNPAWGRLRDDYGVDPLKVGGMESLYCDGVCGWHDDQHMNVRYSLLYVVRNDTGSYVQSKMAPPVKDQPVGTMIYLDIYKKHRLWHPKGMKSPLGVYLALCIDLEEKPTSKRKCEQMMREFIKNPKVFSEAA
jgi:hypothetical protein